MGPGAPLPPDSHEQTQTLLPWYVSGQLESEDLALVEAHLRDCAECRAEFQLERRLEKAVAGLPFDAELGWAQIRGRIAAQDDQQGARAFVRRVLLAPGARTGWAIAAQFVLVVAAVGMLLPLTQPARYHALGAAPPAPSGDVIVMFRPEAQAQDLSRTLRDSGARLVDGPTAADAYVLAVPLARRATVLTQLRANVDIVMAEPIDPAIRP